MSWFGLLLQEVEVTDLGGVGTPVGERKIKKK